MIVYNIIENTKIPQKSFDINRPGPMGLFAYFIEAISFYFRFPNDKIIIQMEKNCSYYTEDIKWTDNPWEYYFVPEKCDAIEEVRKYDSDFFARMNDSFRSKFIVMASYVLDERFFEISHHIVNQRIKIRQEIMDDVNMFYEKHMAGKKVISVHKRNVSHYVDYPHPHRKAKYANLSADVYFDRIEKSEIAFDKIFLMTDELDARIEFEKRYGDKLIHYDSEVAPAGTYILNELSGYEIGRQVLIEVLLAAKTDYFFPARSNVSLAVRMFNKNIGVDSEMLT
jgi:hypothetical protein